MAARSGSFLKKSIPYLCLGGGVCAGLTMLYPHTVGLDHYRSLYTIYTPEGKEEIVDHDLQLMAEKIKKDLGWLKRPMESTETITLFPSSSLEFEHFGTSKSRYGGFLGVPQGYLSKYKQNEKYFSELFRSMNIDPSSETARDIRQSFDLSDSAKMFAMARELKMCKSLEMFFMCVGAQFAVSSFYLIPNVMSVVPFPGMKLLTFLALVPFWYIVGSGTLKYSGRSSLKSADKTAASISVDVARGGLEYYDAMILRQNVCKRANIEDQRDNRSILQKIAEYSWHDYVFTLKERKQNLEKLLQVMYDSDVRKETTQ